jgi:4-amino-4-deoxychorismate lyase
MQLLETIRFNLGSFSNLDLHQERLNSSRKILFNCTDEIDLNLALASYTTKIQSSQLHKCRVVYDTEIRYVEFIPYKIPIINSLKMVNCDEIKYDHKYAVRDGINNLMLHKDNADDIIIIKNGLITDTSYGNLLFFNGLQWVTPAQPLLKGTQRAKLLKQEQIITAEIRPADLANFTKVRIINAMLRFEDKMDVVVNKIY